MFFYFKWNVGQLSFRKYIFPSHYCLWLSDIELDIYRKRDKIHDLSDFHHFHTNCIPRKGQYSFFLPRKLYSFWTTKGVSFWKYIICTQNYYYNTPSPRLKSYQKWQKWDKIPILLFYRQICTARAVLRNNLMSKLHIFLIIYII